MSKRIKIFLLFLFSLSCIHPEFQKKQVDFSKWGHNFLNIENFKIHYQIIGDGKTILFLHGLGSFQAIWQESAKLLSSYFKCILVDIPGYGLSDRYEIDYTPQGLAQKLHSFLEQLGTKKISIVAHSWGAGIALSFTLKYPEYVDKIVIVDGWIYPEQTNSFLEWTKKHFIGEILTNLFFNEQIEYRYTQGFYNPEKYVSEDFIDIYKDFIKIEGSKAVFLASVRGFKSIKENDYKKIKNESLIIWCEEDRVSDLHYGKLLHNELENSELVIFSLCSHFPMIEQEKRFVNEIKKFLK